MSSRDHGSYGRPKVCGGYGCVKIMVQYNKPLPSCRHRQWRLMLDGLLANATMAGGLGNPLPYLVCCPGGYVSGDSKSAVSSESRVDRP